MLARNVFSAGVVFPAVLVAFGYVIVQVGTPLWFFGMCAMFFFTGALIFYFLAKFRNNKALIILLCLASLCYFAHFVISGIVERKPFTNTEGYLLVPIVTFAALIDVSGIGRAALRKVKWIGDATYSIYLWHFPIQVLILTAMYRFSVDRSFFNSPGTLLVWIAGMLMVGRLSFKYIERPLQSAARKWAYENISVGVESIHSAPQGSRRQTSREDLPAFQASSAD
jgi:peptidoglycan/LPS O-acetylase OafA/YrhL